MRLLFFLLFIFLLNSGCSLFSSNDDNPVDLRSLTWEADTLWHEEYQNIMLESIYGKNINNVSAVGYSTDGMGHHAYNIYNFKENHWQVEHYDVLNGGNIEGWFNAHDVFVFSENDKWVCGQGNLTDKYKNWVIHYNGSQWSEVPFDLSIDDPHWTGLESVWGDSPDDIWFCGGDGGLYHWNGSIIRRDFFAEPYVDHTLWASYPSNLTGDSNGNVYYLMGTADSTGNNEVFYLFKRENSKWEVLNKLVDNYWGIQKIWCSPSGTLYGCTYHGIQKYDFVSNSWKAFGFLNNMGSVSVFGTSDNNLFVAASSVQGNSLFHYNGIDWQQIAGLDYRDVWYRSVWTDGRDAFLMGFSNRKTIIFHGK